MGETESPTTDVTDAWIRDLRRALLAFFDERRRDLPWHHTVDPYGIWVSEVMLQQTRVETVIPYYERWMRRFPTIDALADADGDDVLRIWQGLGYYRRARNLQRAARAVRETHSGRVPDTAAALLDLPGVGRYTAGAIASIAYGRREPAVDGNVRRVLHRLIDEGDVPDAALRALAARLVPAARPGDFNQAFMELGSTLCSPRAPSCGGCALARLCRANAKGTQLERPTPRRASPVPDFDVGTAIVTADGHVLVRRRPEHGLLAGMWEFPGEIVGRRDSARRAARRAAARHGVLLDRRAGELLAALPHLFSHRREIYHAYGFDLAGPVKQPEAGAIWVTRVELADLPMPAAQRRIAWFALPSDPATG